MAHAVSVAEDVLDEPGRGPLPNASQSNARVCTVLFARSLAFSRLRRDALRRPCLCEQECQRAGAAQVRTATLSSSVFGNI
jgi:hypothetical protein